MTTTSSICNGILRCLHVAHSASLLFLSGLTAKLATDCSSKHCLLRYPTHTTKAGMWQVEQPSLLLDSMPATLLTALLLLRSTNGLKQTSNLNAVESYQHHKQNMHGRVLLAAGLSQPTYVVFGAWDSMSVLHWPSSQSAIVINNKDNGSLDQVIHAACRSSKTQEGESCSTAALLGYRCTGRRSIMPWQLADTAYR